ncbi:N-acetylmuramoyl-L-alanine amidase [Holdemanella biformis]|uniref:N-acetylmuramoyl-L-alanine amidase n=1 Tax=Holdemanella biformis TaxID=1735 RepID=UPI003AB60011
MGPQGSVSSNFFKNDGQIAEIWVTDMEEAVTVEENILGSVSRTFDLRNRGVKIRDFLVITEIKRQGVSSCLIENGFLDDEDDMKIIFNHLDDYGKTIALAIAEGFGIA